MKLHLDDNSEGKMITAHGPGWVEIAGQRHEGAMLLGNRYQQRLGPAEMTFAQLDLEVVAAVVKQAPSLVLYGTGEKFALAPPELVGKFAAAGIGVEAMDTRAICRTYNILVGEDREVAAFLFHSR